MRSHPRIAALGAVGIPLAVAGIALWDPARHGGPPLCPFRAATGTACPGCGLTRAAGSLLRGRVDEALHVHPLIVLVAVQVALLWVVGVAALVRERPRRPGPPAWVTPLVVVETLLFVGVWGTRLVTGTLPTA
jgi:hypothetical protein